jgi:hypothetical protein
MTKKTRYFMGGSAAILVAGLGTGLVAFYGGGFPSLSASRSGPSELSYVPADAAVVAFANVREVMDSQLRQRLKAVLPQEQGQKEFRDQTGIDIERDIDYIVAAATRIPAANGSSDPGGLVIARGNFNAKMLEDLAVQHGGVIEEYKSKKLVKSPKRDTQRDAPAAGAVARPGHEAVVLAFLEYGLVGIGSEAAIKSAIDAQLTAHSITSNNEMMELIADIDLGNNAWAVGRFDAIANQAKLPPEIAAKLPAIKTFAAMTHIDGGITGRFRAETKDDESANNLRQVVQGLLALGRMTNDPKATALINSLQLSGSGKTVSLSFAVPSEVLDLIPQHIKKDGNHYKDGQPHEMPRELYEVRPPTPPAPPKPPTPER